MENNSIFIKLLVEIEDIDEKNGYWYLQYFIVDFCDSLEDENYQSDAGLWANPGDRPDEKGIKC